MRLSSNGPSRHPTRPPARKRISHQPPRQSPGPTPLETCLSVAYTGLHEYVAIIIQQDREKGKPKQELTALKHVGLDFTPDWKCRQTYVQLSMLPPSYLHTRSVAMDRGEKECLDVSIRLIFVERGCRDEMGFAGCDVCKLM